MKSLKYAKKISTEATAFAQLIESYCTNINKEYMKQMLQLLKEISIGEGIDFNILKHKYIKKTTPDNEETMSLKSEVLFDKIIYENKIYYIDRTNDNDAYDINSNKIGTYKNEIMNFL